MSPSTTEVTDQVEAPPVTVDPGQVIRVNARFPDAPKTVLFSHLPPGNQRAVHDPGADKQGSRIEHLNHDLYSFSIDTRGMHGGLGWWYFVSEDADISKRRAKVGKFTVRDVPRALLDRDSEEFWAADDSKDFSVANESEDSGLCLLGADSSDADEKTHPVVVLGVGVAIGATLALLGYW